MMREAKALHSAAETALDAGWSLGRDLARAFVRPRGAWNGLRRWALLARSTDLPYAALMRYRRELRDDREFQKYLVCCRRDIHYVFPEAAELHAVVRALKPGVVVETGVASGISSAHILRALAANGRGTLYSIDLPNVQEGSAVPEGRTPGWMVPEALRGRWTLRIGDSRRLSCRTSSGLSTTSTCSCTTAITPTKTCGSSSNRLSRGWRTEACS